METIEINDKNRDVILDLLGKEIDREGYIVDKKTKKRLVCPYSKERIPSENFSIMPGSFVFINNYSYCFTEHMVKNNLY